MVKSEKQRLHLEKINEKKGEENHNWKGGTRKHGKHGYIRQYCITHPNCDKSGYVLQHRLVMERHMGRTLLPTEVVHHINEDTSDNRIENLMLFSSVQKHHLLHHKGKKYKKRVLDK